MNKPLNLVCAACLRDATRQLHMRTIKVSPIRLPLAAVQNANEVQYDIAPGHQALERRVIVNVSLHHRHGRVHQQLSAMLQLAGRYVYNVPLRHQATHHLSPNKPCPTNHQNTHSAP
jgi:hypothetical protein